MASKKEKELKGGPGSAATMKFFSAANRPQEATEEQKPQGVAAETKEQWVRLIDGDAEPQKATGTPEAVKAEEVPAADGKADTGANTKPKRQVFSFRGEAADIKKWKSYATATGRRMEDIGTQAMQEYIERHPLDGQAKKVYDVLTENVDK